MRWRRTMRWGNAVFANTHLCLSTFPRSPKWLRWWPCIKKEEKSRMPACSAHFPLLFYLITYIICTSPAASSPYVSSFSSCPPPFLSLSNSLYFFLSFKLTHCLYFFLISPLASISSYFPDRSLLCLRLSISLSPQCWHVWDTRLSENFYFFQKKPPGAAKNEQLTEDAAA